MKIISNFKDYYDYMVSKYGLDPKIVYNRVPERLYESKFWEKSGLYVPDHKIMGKNRTDSWTIHFCDRQYHVYYAHGDWFFGPDVLNINENRYPSEHTLFNGKLVDVYGAWKQRYVPTDTKSMTRWARTYFTSRRRKDEHGAMSDINKKHNCPVVLIHGVDTFKNPRLADFNFGKIIKPDDAFVSISNWLSREESIVDYRTDKEKIVSHGFDPKTSFRKM